MMFFFFWLTSFFAKTPWSLSNLSAFSMIYKTFSSYFWTEIIDRLKKPPPVYRPVVPPEYAPPECLQLMKQCWAEAAEQWPTFDEIFNQVRNLWILALPRSHPKASLPKTNSLGSHHIVKGNSCKRKKIALLGEEAVGWLPGAFDTVASPAHPLRAQWLILMCFCIWTSVSDHLQSDLTNLSELELNDWALARQWHLDC